MRSPVVAAPAPEPDEGRNQIDYRTPGIKARPKRHFGWMAVATIAFVTITLGGLWLYRSRPRSIAAMLGSKGTITGGVWITKKSGQSDLQRGAEIMLLRQTTSASAVAAAIDENVVGLQERIRDPIFDSDVRNAQYKILSAGKLKQSLSGPADVAKAYAMLSAIAPHRFPRIGSIQRECQVATAKSRIDGKYTFADVPQGKYYLSATIISGHSIIEWLVPVTVDGGTVNVDLENDNAIMIENY